MLSRDFGQATPVLEISKLEESIAADLRMCSPNMGMRIKSDNET